MIVDQSGTTSALTIGTETQLGSNSTTSAIYQTKVNLNNLASGDVLKIRVYSQDITSGTISQAFSGTYFGVQARPLKFTIPIPSDFAYKVTLTQTAGTGRTFTWEILRF